MIKIAVTSTRVQPGVIFDCMEKEIRHAAAAVTPYQSTLSFGAIEETASVFSFQGALAEILVYFVATGISLEK